MCSPTASTTTAAAADAVCVCVYIFLCAQGLCLSGDESASLLQHWAQLVLNCMADLVACEGGLQGLSDMMAGEEGQGRQER